MPKRYCKCPNEHCFDRAIQCVRCDPEDLDPEGYPSKARRRLTNEDADGMVVDIDTRQKFKVNKVKGGKRLVPQFKGRMDWKTAKGFAAMCLILSCLGAEGEYVLWDENTNAEMTEKEWRRRGYKVTDKPPLRHCVCGEVVTSTCIANLQQGRSIGCTCNSNHANHWRHRRPEVVAMGAERGFEVRTTEEEWADECTGCHYRPKTQCVKCNEVVTSTTITDLQTGHNIGCTCNSTRANHWRHRRAEVVAMGAERGFEVLTTEEEWADECTGCQYCPTCKCIKCKEVVTSTAINDLQQGRSIGCTCNSNHANHWRHRRPEVVAMGAERGFEVRTTEEEWTDECTGCHYRPKTQCVKCNEVVTSTTITDLQTGHNIGCSCNSTRANHWRHRRAEVVAMGAERGFEVRTTEKEWADECTGCQYCPTLKCVECKEVVTNTCITSLQKGHHIGCTCNSTHANHWRHRRPEVVAMGAERGFEVRTTEEEWADECTGCHYRPKTQCVKCKEVVTSTAIAHLQSGGSIGCSCHNKTEGKLRVWLEQKFPEATVNTRYRGPKTDCGGQTHFDFHLNFPDDFEILIELDGAQHFWSHLKYYTDGGCERDLFKEEWAIAKGLSIVRVLQEDAWEDKLDWQGWLTKSIEAARSGELRVLTPNAPEYRSANSVYVQLRSSCDLLIANCKFRLSQTDVKKSLCKHHMENWPEGTRPKWGGQARQQHV